MELAILMFSTQTSINYRGMNMVQNIKTEVIYYGINSDFEFEFNLCGCCQMRMLKENVSDNASLLKALQRGITRSRIIIIVGNVLGENGTINLVSKAIGYKCETLDTKVYEVNSQKPILLIKNSVPLITKDGSFGGCIIESGPQSMIFLSEDKKIRKEIMNSLVNSYITDLSRFPIPLPTHSDVEPEDDFQVEQTEEIEEVTPVVEETEEITETAPIEFEDFSTFSENSPEEPESDPYDINNLPTSEDIDLAIEENDEEESEFFNPKKVDLFSHQLNILTLILSVILLALLAFIIYSYVYLPLSQGVSIAENFKNVFSFLRNT